MTLDLLPAAFIERMRALSPEGVALAEKATNRGKFAVSREATLATFTSRCGARSVSLYAWANYGLVMPGAYTTNGNVWEAARGVACQLAYGYSTDVPEANLFDYELEDGSHPHRAFTALRVAWALLDVQLTLEENRGR